MAARPALSAITSIPDVATSYNNMAGVHSAQGQYGEALELYKQSLAIRLKVHGPDHPDVASSYNNMAVVHYEQGQYEEALELLKKGLAIRLKVHGPDHPDVVEMKKDIRLTVMMITSLRKK